MTHTFTSFIRDDEGLRESGCQNWQFFCPHPTTPRRNMKRPLVCSLQRPRLLSGTRRHSCCHRCPMARVYRYPSTDYWLIHVPLKPSPLPASPTRDFCHVASLHGSCGTEDELVCQHITVESSTKTRGNHYYSFLVLTLCRL